MLPLAYKVCIYPKFTECASYRYDYNTERQPERTMTPLVLLQSSSIRSVMFRIDRALARVSSIS